MITEENTMMIYTLTIVWLNSGNAWTSTFDTLEKLESYREALKKKATENGYEEDWDYKFVTDSGFMNETTYLDEFEDMV